VVLCSYAASVSCKAQAVLNDFTNEQNNGQQNTANAVCVLKVYGVNMEILLLSVYAPFCLQCFDAVGWATGRASGL